LEENENEKAQKKKNEAKTIKFEADD